MPPAIVHLFEVPQLRRTAAELIHEEFWRNVPGASLTAIQARLALADSAEHLPLALVALHEAQVIAAVNLVDNDDEDYPEWHPWLAGLVVAPAWRGRGLGSALVLALLAHASRLGVPRVYFGTDGPGSYTRLGAVHHHQPRADFWFMRFEVAQADWTAQ